MTHDDLRSSARQIESLISATDLLAEQAYKGVLTKPFDSVQTKYLLQHVDERKQELEQKQPSPPDSALYAFCDSTLAQLHDVLDAHQQHLAERSGLYSDVEQLDRSVRPRLRTATTTVR